ncbi:MAG: sugar phosphate isomerase/epimerase [Pirellulaceae bacterium]|nr:sugar phosphate isomerase/epimerase [Pirellulaceae bacterium]
MKTPDISRRGFLAGSLATAALATWPKPTSAAEVEPAKNPICAFTKFLGPLSYPQLAETIARLGFDGVEATVRAKGQVLPERAEEDLPKLVEALAKHGLELTIMTTSVTRADQPTDEKLLRLAAGLGVKRYRMGYYTYDLDRPVKPQLDAVRPVVRELAAMNREIGIQGLYQNHAGARYVGATVWDFQSLIDEIPVAEIGFAFDIRHAVAEAGLAWPVLQNVAEPHLGAVCVKDFRWEGNQPENVPLGQGRVDRNFLRRCQQAAFQGPFSLHIEYLEQADVEPNIEALGQDLATLKQWIAEVHSP